MTSARDTIEAILSSPATRAAWADLTDHAAQLDGEDALELAPRVHAWAGDERELVAPAAWVERMVAGDYAEQDALIGALDLADTKLSGAKIVKLLKSPHLTHLKTLDVGRLNVSNTFWKSLRTLDSTRTLRTLRCGYFTDRNSKKFDGEHHLDELRTLIVRQSSVVKDAHLRKLLCAPMAAQVTHLVIEMTEPDLVNWMLYALRDEEPLPLPALERVTIATDKGAPLKNFFEDPICERVEVFAVRMRPLYSDLYEQLRCATEGGAAGPERLDLSGLNIDPDSRDDFTEEQLTNIMNDALRMWQKPTQTKVIALGRWWNEEVAELLAADGVEATR